MITDIIYSLKNESSHSLYQGINVSQEKKEKKEKI